MLLDHNKDKFHTTIKEINERKDLITPKLKNKILIGITYCVTYQIVQIIQFIIIQNNDSVKQIGVWIFPAEGVPIAFLLYFGPSILPFVFMSFLSNEIIINSPLVITFARPLLKTIFYGINTHLLKHYINQEDSFQPLKNTCVFFCISVLNIILIPVYIILILIFTNSFNYSTLELILDFNLQWFLPVLAGIFSFGPFLYIVIFPYFSKVFIQKKIKHKNVFRFETFVKLIIYVFTTILFTILSNLSSGISFSLFLVLLIVIMLKFGINQGIILNNLYILSVSIGYTFYGDLVHLTEYQVISLTISFLILVIGALDTERNFSILLLEKRNVRLQESENRYKLLSEHLESLVNEKTYRLEELNKDLELFSYSLSHDLKIPLQTITNLSILLQENPPILNETEKNETIGKIKNISGRLTQLITDLLDFFKFQHKSFSRKKFKMDAVVLKVIDQLNIEKEEIKISVHDLPEISGDFSLLSQVWMNLLTNSIKYSNPNVKLKVEIGSIFENGSNIFFIRDNGIGFNMKYANDLFKSFSRLPNSSDIQGSGIGLYFVKKIIESHHGQIWAESEVNIGTTFYFTLPE